MTRPITDDDIHRVTYAAYVHAGTSNPEALALETLGGKYLLANPRVFARLAQQGGHGKRVRV